MRDLDEPYDEIRRPGSNRRSTSLYQHLQGSRHTAECFSPEYNLWCSAIRLAVSDAYGSEIISVSAKPNLPDTCIRFHAKEFLKSEFILQVIDLLSLEKVIKQWKELVLIGERTKRYQVTRHRGEGKKRARAARSSIIGDLLKESKQIFSADSE